MLTITVSSHNAKPMAQPLSAEFGETGGTIGRAPENTLTLLDPDRKISRTHATVLFNAGTFSLRDQGSVVPVLLNGQPLGNGRESPIRSGDEIRIAGYVLHVAGGAGAAADAAPAASAEPVPAPAAPAASLAAAAATGTTATPAAPAESAESAAPAAPATPAPSAAAAPPAADPATSMPAPVLSWNDDAPSDASRGITTVILAASAHRAAAAPMPEAEPVAAAPATQPAATRAPAGDDELLGALLKGAGIRSVAIPGGLSPELMHQLGELLHEGTRGLLDLLAARALTKKQVRADMTVIVARDNNPLKFAPNIEAALSHLLAPSGRGFMPPVRAVGDAYDDLRAHQLGFMEGMRSAMALVLARFNPDTLEHQLAERSMVDSILPGNRKAKLWDMFAQLYGEISKAAESDFHALFGQEFLRAYQAHVAKLPDSRAPAEH